MVLLSVELVYTLSHFWPSLLILKITPLIWVELKYMEQECVFSLWLVTEHSKGVRRTGLSPTVVILIMAAH